MSPEVEQIVGPIIVFSVLGALIYFFYLAFTDKVIVYYDYNDFSIACIPIGSAIAGFLIFVFLGSKDESVAYLIMVLSIIGMLVGVFLSYKNAIQHSGGLFLGLFIGTFKLLFSTFAIFVIIDAFTKEDGDSTKSYIQGMIWGAIVIAIVHLLINGQRVEEKRWRGLLNG